MPIIIGTYAIDPDTARSEVVIGTDTLRCYNSGYYGTLPEDSSPIILGVNGNHAYARTGLSNILQQMRSDPRLIEKVRKGYIDAISDLNDSLEIAGSLGIIGSHLITSGNGNELFYVSQNGLSVPIKNYDAFGRERDRAYEFIAYHRCLRGESIEPSLFEASVLLLDTLDEVTGPDCMKSPANHANILITRDGGMRLYRDVKRLGVPSEKNNLQIAEEMLSGGLDAGLDDVQLMKLTTGPLQKPIVKRIVERGDSRAAGMAMKYAHKRMQPLLIDVIRQRWDKYSAMEALHGGGIRSVGDLYLLDEMLPRDMQDMLLI